jgi:hypothetical protein
VCQYEDLSNSLLGFSPAHIKELQPQLSCILLRADSLDVKTGFGILYLTKAGLMHFRYSSHVSAVFTVVMPYHIYYTRVPNNFFTGRLFYGG